MQISKYKRRQFLTGIGALSAAAWAGTAWPNSALAQVLATPRQGEGPFYPIDKPIDQDADLAQLGNSRKRAAGDPLLVQGRILDAKGGPVPGARVEIWQANAWGRYQDRRQRSDAPWDPNFQGYGHVTTGADGQYAFRTIRPGGYGQGFRRRTPHIHFRISGDRFDRFTTQMYFAGEPGNVNDGLLNRITSRAARNRLIVDLKPALGKNSPARIGVFDVVLG